MPKERRVIGLDVGSSGVKAVLYSDGELVDISRVEYGAPASPFMSSRYILEAANRSVKKVMKGRGEPEAVCISCMFPTFMILDENLKPKVIAQREGDVSTWADNLASSNLTLFMQGDVFHKETGCLPHPQYPVFKAMLRRHSQIRDNDKIVTLHDYILYTLTGKEATSRSVASTTGFLRADGSGWSDKMMYEASIDKEHLFNIVETGDQLSAARSVYMDSILPGTVVVPGAGDGLLAHLGAGAMKDHCATTTIGTTSAVRKMKHPNPVIHAKNNIWCHYFDKDTFVYGSSLSDGMSTLDWLEHAFGKKPSDAAIKKMASSGPFFLPFMNGERGPHWKNEAKGGFIGLTRDDDYRTMYRSAMEGILLALDECYDIISETPPYAYDSDEIRATGGYVNSPAMLQMQADIFGHDISVPAEKEASAAGAAYIAMKSLGIIDKYPDVPIARTYEPDMQKNKKYGDRMLEFRRLID